MLMWLPSASDDSRNKNRWVGIIDKPKSKSQSKVQAHNPKRQIQKIKGIFGLWAVLQALLIQQFLLINKTKTSSNPFSFHQKNTLELITGHKLLKKHLITWSTSTYFCLYTFSIWLFRRWGHRKVFIRPFLLWSTGLIWPGGAVGLWELRKRVSLSSLRLKIISSLITGVLRAPGGAIVSHTWLSSFLLPRKSNLRSKCRIISPRLRNEGHFQQISFFII